MIQPDHPTLSIVQQCRLASIGRRELATLVGHVDLALGDSDFNRRELETLGFAPTGVMPIAVDLDRITKAPPRPARGRLPGPGTARPAGPAC